MRLRVLFLFIFLSCGTLSAQAPARLPVPDEAKVQEAVKLIAEVYKKDYEAAKTPQQKQTLAKKMLKDGEQTKDDSAAKFALFQVARKVGISLGDVDLAMRAVEATGNSFETDVATLQQEVIQEIAPQAKTTEDHYALTRYLGRMLPPLLRADNYSAVKEQAELASSAAKKSRDPDLLKQWTRRADEIAAAEKAFIAAQAGLETLKSDPANAAANGVVGKYVCFIKEDWEKGLPMLALGDDPDLQMLAEHELKGIDKQAEQLAQADKWREIGQRRSAPEKNPLLRRAAAHYERLIPSLSALPRRRVQKDLAEIRAATSPFTKEEWVEILDLVDLRKHQIEGQWQRQGLAIVMPTAPHCKSFKIPVEADGAYELRVRAARFDDGDALSVNLSHSANRVMFALNCYKGRFSGLHAIGNAGADHNPSKTAAAPIVNGVPYTLVLQVEPKEDQVSIGSFFNNKRYSRWAGPLASLDPHDPRRSGPTFIIGTCHTRIAVYSVQLKVRSGGAWITN